jgi:hypothetical protein
VEGGEGFRTRAGHWVSCRAAVGKGERQGQSPTRGSRAGSRRTWSVRSLASGQRAATNARKTLVGCKLCMLGLSLVMG